MMFKPTQQEIDDILSKHKLWLEGKFVGGEMFHLGGTTGFDHFDLTGINFTGADLTRANLEYAILTDANFTEANLTDANLAEANLTRANLRGANLTWTNLHDATLTGATLTGADLTKTIILGVHIYNDGLEQPLSYSDIKKATEGEFPL